MVQRMTATRLHYFFSTPSFHKLFFLPETINISTSYLFSFYYDKRIYVASYVHHFGKKASNINS